MFLKRLATSSILGLFLLLVLLVPTANAQSLNLGRNLSVGSHGSDVSALQAFLKTKGFYTYATITGFFGEVTKLAVEAYQSAHHIDPIGIVGPATRASLVGG